MGALVPHASRHQQLDQDGSRHRGLSTYRVRVQQIQVRPVLLYCVAPNPVLVRRYHLKDVIVGKIYFLLVRIKIKHMELSIIRRETTGAVPNQYNESETITSSRSWTAHPYEARQHKCDVQRGRSLTLGFPRRDDPYPAIPRRF